MSEGQSATPGTPPASPKATGAGTVALAAGLLFGAGLHLSGMTDPQKVLAFLTLGAGWDPSLIGVMGSALFVTTLGYALVGRRNEPIYAPSFAEPPKLPIDRSLLLGAGLFGAGWGMSGFCPGPALVGSFLLQPTALLFLAAAVVGMLGLDSFRARAASSTAASLIDG